MPVLGADTPTTFASDKPYANERKQVEICLDLIRRFRRLDPELQRWAVERLTLEAR